MTASAFHIPFKDNSVDAVVCCRLCHHLPNAEQRERLIDELLRVARRFVIMTFFDHHSVKNLLRRARNQLRSQPPKRTMTIADQMYGITMQEPGISTRVSVKFDQPTPRETPAVA